VSKLKILYLRAVISTMKKVLTVLITGFLACGAATQAQEAIVACGGNMAGSNGTVAFSIGQTSWHTNTATAGKVFSGVQQPYEIILIDGQEEMTSLQYRVFPNPFAGHLTLRTDVRDSRSLSGRIHDMQGVLLKEFAIDNPESVIPADELAPATYMLTLTENGKILTTFKIIKK
jgi:hypothetical protein